MVEIRREHILLGLTALVVGLCGWGLYDEWSDPLRPPTWKKQGLEVPALRVPDLASIPTPPRPDDRRDLFGEPRVTRPLPRLAIGDDLPAPIADAPSWVLPSPWPGPRPREWHRFLRVPVNPKEINFDPPEAPPDNGTPEDGGATTTKPADNKKPPSTKATDEVLERSYDRLQPRAGQVYWGRVKNPNKYDLKPDEAIVFQIYDTDKEKPWGAPLTMARADIVSLRLAKTLKNEFEQRRRQIATVSGNDATHREFGLWCLEHGAEEPTLYAGAEHFLTKACELGTSDVRNHLALAKLYEATYRYEKAWKLYRQMIAGEFKASSDARVALAEFEARLGLIEDARANLERSIELEPSSYKPKLALGEYRLRVGRSEMALEPLRAAMRNEPQGPENASVRARIRRRVGEASLALGDLDGAIDAFTKARTVDPDDEESAAGLAAAQWLKKKGGDVGALLDAQIRANPTASALVTRGVARLAAGDEASVRAAKGDFEAAIGLDPVRDVRPLAALAYLFLTTGHFEEGTRALERALRNDPTDPYVLLLNGRLRRERGEFDVALRALTDASMTEEGFVEPLVELGILHSDKDLTEQADRYFGKAAELDSKNAELHGLRGRNLLVGGQIRRAREAFLAGTAVEKDHPLCRLGIALCDYLDGNVTAAKQGLRIVADRKDRFGEYALATLARIEIHEKKEEWVDSFDRQALQMGWDAFPYGDVKVGIVNGECRIEGPFNGTGEATVRRGEKEDAIASRNFRSFEVDVAPLPGNQADLVTFVRREERRGTSVVVPFEIAIVRERTGAVKLRYRLEEDTPPAREIPFEWPEGKKVHVRIERDDDEQSPRARVLLDGRVVAQELKLPRGSAGNLLAGVSAAAETGRTAGITLDNVRVVRMRQ